MTTVVLFDAADANDPARPPQARFMALTPGARLAAGRLGLEMAGVAGHFSDRDHARCVASARKAIKQFDAKSGELTSAVRLMGRQWAWQISHIVHRLARTLPGGPAFVRGGNGWEAAAAQEDAIAILLPRILDYGRASAHRLAAGRPPAPWLFRLLTSAAALVSATGPCFIAAGAPRVRLGFQAAFRARGIGIGSIGVTSGSWRDYRQLLQSVLRRRPTLAIAPLSAGSPAVRRVAAALQDIGSGFTDHRVRLGWRLYLPYMQQALSSMLAIREHAPALLQRLRPSGIVAYEANQATSAAVLEAGLACQLPGFLFNHNSHPRSRSRLADEMLDFMFAQRTCNELVTHALLWSPESLARCEARKAAGGTTTPVPFRADYPRGAARARSRFRVLHAGNYQNWSDYFPWISETSDEYVAGIAALAQAVARLPEIDLVIRVRPKAEVDAELIREAVGAGPNVSIEATETEFVDQLADCDLLVSYFSTTVEQALQMGKPVLLWGHTRRYCQFPATPRPPTPSERAAVYAVHESNRLPEMLQAIRGAHLGRPLSPAETAAYRFAGERPTLAEAAGIVARVQLRESRH